MTKTTLNKEMAKVNQFNRTYDIGDKVKIRFTPSVIEECTVKSPASILGGHSGVVWLKEVASCYSIDSVVY